MSQVILPNKTICERLVGVVAKDKLKIAKANYLLGQMSVPTMCSAKPINTHRVTAKSWCCKSILQRFTITIALRNYLSELNVFYTCSQETRFPQPCKPSCNDPIRSGAEKRSLKNLLLLLSLGAGLEEQLHVLSLYRCTARQGKHPMHPLNHLNTALSVRLRFPRIET